MSMDAADAIPIPDSDLSDEFAEDKVPMGYSSLMMFSCFLRWQC